MGLSVTTPNANKISCGRRAHVWLLFHPSSFILHPLRRGLRPALSKVDKIDDPRDRIEAENRKRDPSPVVTLGEEPAARLALTREVLSLLHSYCDFASSVPLFQICDCGRDLTQLISPINDRFHLSRL